jgi:hydroxymethylglutaryl-CoA reductase (NADPH)
MMIPSVLLTKLYTAGSLKNTEAGAEFVLKNRLTDAEQIGVRGVAIDGAPVPLEAVQLKIGDCGVLAPAQVDSAHPIRFPLSSTLKIRAGAQPLSEGKHQIEVSFDTRPFGNLQVSAEDMVTS